MEFACAQRFAGDGMHVVLADFESEPLALAGATIKVRAAG
jgi:NAD(P)-dependent dehydrogenase (short-subunit alcohol dehydrogenase family)